MLKNFFNNIFGYTEKEDYNFIISKSSNNIDEKNFEKEDIEKVDSSLSKNLEYLKIKYNILINSDIKIREFTLPLKSKKVPAFL